MTVHVSVFHISAYILHICTCIRLRVLIRSVYLCGLLIRFCTFYTPVCYVHTLDGPPVSVGILIHEDSRSHTTHHNQQDSSGRVITWSHRHLTTHTYNRQTSLPGEIRTHSLRRRAAAVLCFRPRGNWERQDSCSCKKYCTAVTL
jgi:hypothetical protein